MARTRNRPLPTGQLGVHQVLSFAFVLALAYRFIATRYMRVEAGTSG